MKKGFTLIELIIVIAILSVILVIIAPEVIGILNNSKTKALQQQIELIKVAAKEYAQDNESTITWTENKTVISLSTLGKTTGTDLPYIKLPITNPKTNKEVNSDETKILISKNNKHFDIEVFLK